MWTNPQFCADLVTLTQEILNAKLHFLCSDICWIHDKESTREHEETEETEKAVAVHTPSLGSPVMWLNPEVK